MWILMFYWALLRSVLPTFNWPVSLTGGGNLRLRLKVVTTDANAASSVKECRETTEMSGSVPEKGQKHASK